MSKRSFIPEGLELGLASPLPDLSLLADPWNVSLGPFRGRCSVQIVPRSVELHCCPCSLWSRLVVGCCTPSLCYLVDRLFLVLAFNRIYNHNRFFCSKIHSDVITVIKIKHCGFRYCLESFFFFLLLCVGLLRSTVSGCLYLLEVFDEENWNDD